MAGHSIWIIYTYIIHLCAETILLWVHFYVSKIKLAENTKIDAHIWIRIKKYNLWAESVLHGYLKKLEKCRRKQKQSDVLLVVTHHWINCSTWARVSVSVLFVLEQNSFASLNLSILLARKCTFFFNVRTIFCPPF